VKRFVWEPAARSDLRRLDRDTAMRILHALTRYGSAGDGNVKRLTDREGLYTASGLASGGSSLTWILPDVVRLHGLDNRGEAY